MARGSIQISMFQPRTPSDPPASGGPGIRAARWITRLLAGIATAVLHLVFLGAVGWGMGSGQSRKPHVLPPTVHLHSGSAEGDSTMQWVQMEDEGQGASGGPPGGPELVLQPVMVEDPQLAPALRVEVDEDTDGPSGTSEPGSSASYRLYIGQMDARIERAWLRPRDPIGARAFSCSVRIEQDERGNVREMVPLRCNGSTRWQQSLLQAIRAASPLPAPPDPAVFRHSITLSFHAQPYSAMSDPDLYEPEGLYRELQN